MSPPAFTLSGCQQALPEAMRFPSGLNATLVMTLGRPLARPSRILAFSESAASVSRSHNSWPVSTRQNLGLPSTPPEASQSPPGLNATANTAPESLRCSGVDLLDWTSHRLTVPSPPADASRSPCGLKATE